MPFVHFEISENEQLKLRLDAAPLTITEHARKHLGLATSKIGARQFLLDNLPASVKQLQRQALQQNIVWSSVVTASVKIGVVKSMTRRHTTWRLPAKINLKPLDNRRSAPASFLLKLLADKEVRTPRIKHLSSQAGYNWRTMQRAANDLNVQRRVEGFGKAKKSYWRLP